VTLADVNVLVHAFRRDSTDHSLCRSWLENALNSPFQYGVSPQVLSSVIRILTHPGIFVHPSSLREALAYCAGLTSHPHCVLIHAGGQHWNIFVELCRTADVRGNLVADAWYAALAIESGCEWITLDRDYARFPKLHWRFPN
jgi:uncharacterized protein